MQNHRHLAPDRPVLHLLYLAANVPLVVAIFAFPAYHTILWGAMGLGAAAAVVIGVRRFRPRRPVACLLVAAALVTFITGDILYDVLTKMLHQVNPYPSVADLFYLVTYPLLAAGLFVMVRARRAEPDSGALLDALTVTAGTFLVSWIYLIQPYVHAQDMTLLVKATSIAYPLGDVLILWVLARLLSGSGLRNGAVVLMGAGGIGLLAADMVYGWIQLNGVWRVGGMTDLGWVAFYLFWGAAALHPGMRQLTETQPRRSRKLSGVTLAALSAVTLAAPLLLVWRVAVLGKTSDAAPIGVVSALLFMLVAARLSGLARAQAQQARREAALRAFGERLVGATELDDVYRAGIDTVHAALGDRVVAVIMSERKARGETAVGSDVLALTGALLHVGGDPGSRTGVQVTTAEPDRAALLPPGARWTLIPLTTGGVERRLLVGTPAALPVEVGAVLAAVGTQLSLALERVELVRALHERRSETRFQTLVQHTSDAIIVVGEGGGMKAETPSVQAVLGYSPLALAGMHLQDLLPEEELPRALAAVGALLDGSRHDSFRTEWKVRHADGRWLPMEVLGTDLSEDEHIAGVVLTMRDVAERKQLEEELRFQAFHDSLTKLANRALFHDRVGTALRQRSRRRRVVSVLLLDLDDFKLINDTFGHAAGDELLVQFAARLLGCLRQGDTAARLGGDEFAICLESDPGDFAPSVLASRIEQAMRAPFCVAGADVTVHVSIGVSTAEGEPRTAEEMLREADLALYAAKNAGKATFRFFEPFLHDEVVSRMEQRASLDKALSENQLACHYQPIVRLSDRAIMGVEALVRWNHPHRGLVPPGEFIPVAEEAGLMGALGLWVLEQACVDLAAWQAELPEARDLRLSVNVSAQQLYAADFAATVDRCLAEHGLAPSSLILELTESVLALDQPDLARNLKALRDRGIGLALDDFGTGYSSLSYLHRFPFSTLKIDRSFIVGMDREEGVSLVDAIVSIGHSLGLGLVAEGIEREDQAAHLRKLGCQLAQGYLFGRPMTAQALAAFLRRGEGRAEPGEPVRLRSAAVLATAPTAGGPALPARTARPGAVHPAPLTLVPAAWEPAAGGSPNGRESR